MTVSIVQSRQLSSAGAQTSLAIAFSSGISSTNNCLVAVVMSPAGGRTWTLSDTVNGSWPTASSSFAGGTASQSLFVFPPTLVGTGTPTVTATMVGGSAGIQMCIMEVSGLSGTVDQVSVAGTGVGTSSSKTTGALAMSGELALGVIATAVTVTAMTPGGSYSLVNAQTNNLGVSFFVTTDASAQTGSWTWTTSSNSSTGIYTIEPQTITTQFLPFSSTQFMTQDRLIVS